MVNKTKPCKSSDGTYLMSFDHNCQFQSSQCNNREITVFLLNILASLFVQPLFCALNFCIGIFHGKFDLFIKVSKCKQILKNGFSGCKNRICHHKFKLDARNNGWTKKEAKIFRRNSVISQILHWLDWNRQL